MNIVGAIPTVISGMLMNSYLSPDDIILSVRNLVKLLMLNAGIVQSDNGWLAMFAKRYLSLNLISIITSALNGLLFHLTGEKPSPLGGIALA